MKVQEHISPIEQYVIDFVIKLRKEKNLTQDAIGSILEISKSYIADIESRNANGKYNMTHVNILADHFNISPRDFFPEKAILPVRLLVNLDKRVVVKRKLKKVISKKKRS